MKLHPARAITILICLLLALPIPSLAQRPGKSFESPLKNFTVLVPQFPFGTKVKKQNDKNGGTVSFSGDLGHARRIDYSRLPPDTPVPTDSTEQQASYGRVLKILLESNPSSLIVEKPYLLDKIPMLFAIVSFPEGSHLANAGTGKRMDSVRGLLFFVRGAFLYVLHAELSSGVFSQPGEGQLAPEELTRRAELFLPELYRSITFQ
jgi:hypothetical protein